LLDANARELIDDALPAAIQFLALVALAVWWL